MDKQAQNIRTQRYVKISLAAHAALFLFMFAGNFVFPNKPIVINPSVQIDMVALPNQVKEAEPTPVDTTLPVKPNPPPPPPPEEKQEDEPEPAPIKAPPPTKEKDAAKEAKAALERMREQLKKNQKKQEADKRKQQQEQVDQRQKDLKRFEDAYRSAIQGNQTHKGTNSTGDMVEAANAYGAHITERLRSNWGLPAWLQNKGLRAVVRIFINSNGSVARFVFVQTSGNDVFDEYVKTTVQKSSPFAPPPEELAKGLRNSGVEVLFPL